MYKNNFIIIDSFINLQKKELKMKKLLLLIVLVLLSVTMIAAYSLEGKAEELPMKGVVVGYLPGSLQDPARVVWSDNLEKTLKEAGCEKFIVIDSAQDVTKQINDGEDILQMGIDILVLNPNDADAMIPIVKKANDMGIPVVCLDRKTNGGEVISTVSGDNWQIGEEAAKLLVKLLNGKGKVLHIQGTLGASVVYERGESFRQVMKNYPDMVIIGEPSSDHWTTEDGLAFTEDALSAHPDLDAIYAQTDSIILGAFNAVEAAGKTDHIIFCSQGWYGEIPNIMKERRGKIYDWAFNCAAIGQAAADVVIKIAQGKVDIIPKTVLVPCKVVTPDNVDEMWEKYNLNLVK
jgi:ribose transport system substrate-binding protein